MSYLRVKLHTYTFKNEFKYIAHYLCIISHGVWLHLQDIISKWKMLYWIDEPNNRKASEGTLLSCESR